MAIHQGADLRMCSGSSGRHDHHGGFGIKMGTARPARLHEKMRGRRRCPELSPKRPPLFVSFHEFWGRLLAFAGATVG